MGMLEILDECATIISGLPGAANVRVGQILEINENAWKSSFLDGTVANAVEITEREFDGTPFANAKHQFDHQIIFHVYRGVSLSDNSRYRDHINYVNAIKDIFRTNFRLNGEATRVMPVDMESNDFTMLGGALVYYAVLMLPVRLDQQ